MKKILTDDQQQTILQALHVAANDADEAANNNERFGGDEGITKAVRRAAAEYRELLDQVEDCDYVQLVVE